MWLSWYFQIRHCLDQRPQVLIDESGLGIGVKVDAHTVTILGLPLFYACLSTYSSTFWPLATESLVRLNNWKSTAYLSIKNIHGLVRHFTVDLEWTTRNQLKKPLANHPLLTINRNEWFGENIQANFSFGRLWCLKFGYLQVYQQQNPTFSHLSQSRVNLHHRDLHNFHEIKPECGSKIGIRQIDPSLRLVSYYARRAGLKATPINALTSLMSVTPESELVVAPSKRIANKQPMVNGVILKTSCVQYWMARSKISFPVKQYRQGKAYMHTRAPKPWLSKRGKRGFLETELSLGWELDHLRMRLGYRNESEDFGDRAETTLISSGVVLSVKYSVISGVKLAASFGERAPRMRLRYSRACDSKWNGQMHPGIQYFRFRYMWVQGSSPPLPLPPLLPSCWSSSYDDRPEAYLFSSDDRRFQIGHDDGSGELCSCLYGSKYAFSTTQMGAKLECDWKKT